MQHCLLEYSYVRHITVTLYYVIMIHNFSTVSLFRFLFTIENDSAILVIVVFLRNFLFSYHNRKK